MATQSTIQKIAMFTVLGMAIGGFAILVGIMALLAKWLGVWFWWIGGGFLLLVGAFLTGLIWTIVTGSLDIIKRLK